MTVIRWRSRPFESRLPFGTFCGTCLLQMQATRSRSGGLRGLIQLVRHLERWSLRLRSARLDGTCSSNINLHDLFLPLHVRNNIQPGPPFSCMMTVDSCTEAMLHKARYDLCCWFSCIIRGPMSASLILPFSLRHWKRKSTRSGSGNLVIIWCA